MMTSPKTSVGHPISLQFLPRLQALPLVHSAFCLASDVYVASKARHQRMNPLFNLVEGTIVRVSTTTSYCASALVSLVGGWDALDGWACQGLDKLEAFAPIIKKPAKEVKRELVLKLLTLVEDEEALARIKAAIEKESNTDENAKEANTQESCVCNCLDSSNKNPTLDERSFYTDEDIQNSCKHLRVPDAARITRGLSLDSVYKTPFGLEDSKSRKIAYSMVTLSDSRDNAQKVPWWKKVFQRHSILPLKYEDPNPHNQGGLLYNKEKDILLTLAGQEEGDGIDQSKDRHFDDVNRFDDPVDNIQFNSQSQLESFTPEKTSSRSHSSEDIELVCVLDGSAKQMKYSFENCGEETRERVWSTSTPQNIRKKDLEEATEHLSRSIFGDDKSQEEKEAEKALAE